MRRWTIALALALAATASGALADDSSIRSAQSAIDGQLRAFLADDDAAAYSFAAPSIQRIFPTVDAFMTMVEKAYPMVKSPRTYSFGKVEEMGNRIAQQVLILGPDGKEYEALYTLELQPDGTYKITGVSLRTSNALST